MDDDELRRMTARLEALGPKQVADHAALDSFPHTWRAAVADWLHQQEKARPATQAAEAAE